MQIAVFFDLGDTLVIPQLSSSNSLEGLKVLPFVPEILTRLRQVNSDGSPLRLGVISNTGSETLESMHSVLGKAGLLNLFDPTLLLFSSVEGMDKTQTQFFDLAVQRGGLPPQRCVYVGESEAERKVAASAALRTSYHPLHVFHVIDLMMKGQS